MEEGEIRQLAALQALIADMLAINANVEGMKAENLLREHRGESTAYTDLSFFKRSEELTAIANRMRLEI